MNAYSSVHICWFPSMPGWILRISRSPDRPVKLWCPSVWRVRVQTDIHVHFSTLFHWCVRTWMHTVRCIPVGSHRCRVGFYVFRGRQTDLWSCDARQSDEYACRLTYIYISALFSTAVSKWWQVVTAGLNMMSQPARSALNGALVSTHNLNTTVEHLSWDFQERHKPKHGSVIVTYHLW